jgi:hypothetical protein
MRDARELIYFATLAPSGHNTQPWRFTVEGETIHILPDFTRRLPAVDPDDHALYISLGCALENLVITAGHLGFWAEVDHVAPGGAEDALRVRLRPSRASSAGRLFDAIPLRQTNRRRYDGRPLPAAHLTQLVDASRGDGVWAIPFPGTPEMTRLIPFVEEANRAQFADPEFVSELMSWIRFSRSETEEKRDGLSARTMGLPGVPRWLGRMLMRTFAGPASEARRQATLLRSSSAALLFVVQCNERPHWVELGRAFQRMALLATTLGVQHAHVNMPCEVQCVRSDMRSALLADTGYPLLLVRLGYAPPIARSLRRPVDSVVVA